MTFQDFPGSVEPATIKLAWSRSCNPFFKFGVPSYVWIWCAYW